MWRFAVVTVSIIETFLQYSVLIVIRTVELPTSIDCAMRCSSFCGVDPVLVRTDSRRLSIASSRLDRLWYHRDTTTGSSNDKPWLEKKHHWLIYIIPYYFISVWTQFCRKHCRWCKYYVPENPCLIILYSLYNKHSIIYTVIRSKLISSLCVITDSCWGITHFYM